MLIFNCHLFVFQLTHRSKYMYTIKAFQWYHQNCFREAGSCATFSACTSLSVCLSVCATPSVPLKLTTFSFKTFTVESYPAIPSQVRLNHLRVHSEVDQYFQSLIVKLRSKWISINLLIEHSFLIKNLGQGARCTILPHNCIWAMAQDKSGIG